MNASTSPAPCPNGADVAYPKFLDQTEIKALIPHREPMLLLDQAQVISPSEITGIYHVKKDAFFLHGHYPGNPIVPGNMQSEMLAQLGALLIHYNMTQPELPFGALRKNRTPLLAGLDNVRFKRQVKPGDTLTLHIQLTKDVGLLVNAMGSISIRSEGSPCEEMPVLTENLILAFV